MLMNVNFQCTNSDIMVVKPSFFGECAKLLTLPWPTWRLPETPIDTRPSMMELALGISAASRCCFVYYTYYLSTAPLPSHRRVDDGTCTGHLRGVPVLFRVLHVLPTVSTAPLPSTQGRRRSNLHWASPRRPGVVSCTTRTTYCKYCTIAIDTAPSTMELAQGRLNFPQS